MNDPVTEPPAGAALRRVVEAMPKAELHLHLDGSLRIETALELARTRGIDAPADAPGMAAALIAPMPCASQAELLRAFDLPIALMQDAEALERITTELVETKAADGVRYVEIRWGPLLHVAGGLSLADGIAAVCAGARARRGADRDRRPAHLHGPALARAGGQRDPGRDRRQVPRRGADRLGPGRTRGGVPRPAGPREGLRGGARGRPADHPPRRRVGRRGPGRAGRWRSTPNGSRTVPAPPTTRPCVPSSSRGAVTLDLCPTSNWQAGIVPSLAAHPLARLHRAGVPVTLSTDDTTVSDLSLSEEYVRAVETIGLTLAELWAIDRHALDVAFADEAVLAPLRTFAASESATASRAR